jgi:heme-degrading monooxygenase HmoA
MAKSESIYVRVWELQAKPGMEKEFERVFGAAGAWVKLFRKSKAFLRTELYRDVENSGRYIIVDYFVSQSGFQAFLTKFREQYDALDKLGEGVCASENRIGSFANVGRSKSR